MQVPLLPRIASGDSSAVDECIDRYGGLIWSLARRLTPSVAEAEDAVQEIFIELWKNADRFPEDVAGEQTFVAMLARRRLIDRLRKFRREVDSQPIDEMALQYPAPPPTPPVELAEDGARAKDCLKRLRSDERQVLELSIYHGLPVNTPTKEPYQLWIFDKNQSDKTPIDGGVFDISTVEEVIVPINAKLHVQDAFMFAVTLEKPGGVVVSSRERLPLLAKVE